ncbi:MAG TPA: efflux RND transporter periplasmic adaptor subunit [Deltaproteobacteria bacterium]|jgi:HlyD family secretion protein|nr:efflux RND transporter periplasmic adaptor subunit [Deltaproteobacteria bacterium]HOI06340.1 efflux RND transporter periplasmic adaptor subunit [Deltaproteobacteria bacterium]
MGSNGSLMKKVALSAVLIVLLGALGFRLILGKDEKGLPSGIAMGNGRIEATEVNISTGLPGRLYDVLVKEGDPVKENQILANMDVSTLQAMLRQAEADVRRAKEARRAAEAKVVESKNRLALATKELERSRQLYAKGISTLQQLDRDQTLKNAYEAEYTGLVSKVAEAEAAIEAAIAQTERLKTEIDDCVLRTYCNGRVQTRLAEPGEVLPAGGKVLTVIALDDMYMHVFLPESTAGIVAIGAEAKVVLDAFPDHPFPAKVTFVAEKAQFTPKEVEATEERQKLVFRVKVRIDARDDPRLKPGMPAVAYIRLTPDAEWPATLSSR